MENWEIGVKSLLLFYCGIKYISGNMDNLGITLLAVLIYICLSMLYYVFNRIFIKGLLSAAGLAAVIILHLYINPVFIFLLPVNILELTGTIKMNKLIEAATVAGSALLLKTEVLPEYLLSAFFGLTVFSLARWAYASREILKQQNNKLMDRNDYLSGRLIMGAQHENQVKYLSQLEERNSLSQQIHDKVGHTIAGSLIQLEAASLIIDSDREKAKSILTNTVNHLKEGMESIRMILRSIKPPSEQLGINRLKAVLDQFSAQSSLKTELSYEGRLEVISQSQWAAIMDNLGEALTNTLKYAEANAVKVELTVLNKLVKLEIRDNGRGSAAFQKGLGLSGMEERTGNLGGKLILDGSSGFSVIMLLPIDSGSL